MSAEILYCPSCPATFVLTSWDVAWFGDCCPKCTTPGRPASELAMPTHGFYDFWESGKRQSYVERIRGAQRPQPAGAASVASSSRATPKRVAALLRTVATAPEGRRNGVLYWAAMRMAETDVDRARAAQELLAAALATGLPKAEAGRTIESALGVNPAKSVAR